MSTAETMDLRAEWRRRRSEEERREWIYQRVCDQFRSNGITRTSMEDIAQSAGISRQTIYNYYNDRTTLLLEVHAREARRINDQCLASLDFELPSRALIAAALIVRMRVTRAGWLFKAHDEGFGTPPPGDVVVDRAPEIIAARTSYWMPIIDRVKERGELRDGLDIGDTIEWLATIFQMLVSRPDRFTAHSRTRNQLIAFVSPAVVRDDAKG